MYYDVCYADQCDCIYNINTNNLENLCTYCHKREYKERENPWYIEIKTIKKYLHYSETTDDIKLKILYIKNIFEFLLTRPDFIAKNPNFRNSIISKIYEFKNDDKGKDIHELCDNLDTFIKNLSKKDNYIE